MLVGRTKRQTLHRVLYKRPGVAHEVKKNIREFGGFHFVDKVRLLSLNNELT